MHFVTSSCDSSSVFTEGQRTRTSIRETLTDPEEVSSSRMRTVVLLTPAERQHGSLQPSFCKVFQGQMCLAQDTHINCAMNLVRSMPISDLPVFPCGGCCSSNNVCGMHSPSNGIHHRCHQHRPAFLCCRKL